MKHVAGGYKLRARPAEFCAMGEYLDTFSQKLGTIDRIAQRILKEQSGRYLSGAHTALLTLTADIILNFPFKIPWNKSVNVKCSFVEKRKDPKVFLSSVFCNYELRNMMAAS